MPPIAVAPQPEMDRPSQAVHVGESLPVDERRLMRTSRRSLTDTDRSRCATDHHRRASGNDECSRKTPYPMRLRFVAIPFRRAMMTNTSTTNRTPEITRIVVGSIEARSLYVRAPASAPCLPYHRRTWGRKRANVSSGFRIMFRLELPVIDNLSATRLPNVNAPAPEPPFMVRQVVFVPQVAPLPA
jgi:hypothetical protein